LALPPSGTTDEAFLREVDEEYRRDQVANIWRRYGRWIIAAVVVALLALAVFLYLDHRGNSAAGQRGEQYDAALRMLNEGQGDKAVAEFDKLAGGKDGYAALSKIAQGNALLERGNAKGAAAKFAEVAGNSAFEQPYRDMALVRQTVAEFDTLKPDAVIQRLKPMTDPNSPWLGTAGEMVAAAYLKAGNRAEAGKMYAQIAQGGEKVPESVRARVVQLAGVLGVDATVQAKDNKAQ
jgi:hypothetical protein